MPTLLRSRGFEVRVFPNDHAPPHVHVYRNDSVVIILLGDESQRPTVRNVRTMKIPDVTKALILVAENQQFLLDGWRSIHG